MRSFRLLVFDWDGTLMDSIPRIVASMEAAFNDSGLAVPPQQAIRNMIGLSLSQAMSQLADSADRNVLDRLVDRYRYHFIEASPVPAELFPGTRAMLEALRAHDYILTIATGKARNGLDRVLKDSDCDHLFDGSLCADEGYSKPQPQMLRSLMTEFEVTPQHTLMIGDSLHDLEMARRANTDCLAVTYGVCSRRQLAPYQPLAFVDGINDISSFLIENQVIQDRFAVQGMQGK